MADEKIADNSVEAIWVNVTEGAEITGYNSASLRKLAWTMSQELEDQRPVKVRKRSSGWELWLPDLIIYAERPRRGPPIKRKKSD